MRVEEISLDEAERRWAPGPDAEPARSSSKGPLLVWYGDTPPSPPPYLIRGMLPQTETAILAGQFGSGKTFVAADLAVAVILGGTFAGNDVVRTGAVLWLAAEGANEVDIRIKAALEARMREAPERIPFARQAFTVPQLTAPDAAVAIMVLVEEFRAKLATDFPGVSLVLVVIDTMNSAAAFKDGNDGAEAQAVMDVLRSVSRQTDALVLAVDHFGKAIETGVKGSMNKSDAADAILGVLADKDDVGNVGNRRLTQQKLRNGPTGTSVSFTLESVPVDTWGNTTCTVEWAATVDNVQDRHAKPTKPAWTRTLKILKECIERMLIEHGSDQQPFGVTGPTVKAVPLDRVRTEFVKSYAAETPDAKRKAIKRAIDDARARNLIATYEIGASLQDWVWLLKSDELG